MSETAKKLSDLTDTELGRFSNNEILALAKEELKTISNDRSKQAECRELRQVISDINSGTYVNPFSDQAFSDSGRSDIGAVRSARIVTGFLETINIISTISISAIGIIAWIAMAQSQKFGQGFCYFMLALLASTLSYYLMKMTYVALELLASIADDIRKIRLLQR